MEGEHRSHFELTFGQAVGDAPPSAALDPVLDEGPSTLERPHLTARNRQDLAALFSEYQRPGGRGAPHPKTYRDAAARLGDTAKALEHRVFDLRRKLENHGYPWLDSLEDLAILVVTTGALGRIDFEQLDRDFPPLT